MSCSLPPEILDLIVDHLRDRSAALKACCVVSKSWIPRTRKHLFAHVTFCKKSHIEQWKKTFPNPSNSPAHYTRSLSVRDFPVVTAAEVDVGGWIRPFHRVVNLDVDTRGSDESQVSLIPLHGPLPTLKSLALTYTSVSPSEVFALVCSFPLLEDLELLSRGYESEVDGWKAPFVSPKFTGSLCLAMLGGIRSTILRLLDLPGGLHFSKITVLCLNEDVEPTADLLLGCSDTLEFLTIYYVPDPSMLASFDLSMATNLKELVFHSIRPDVQWITTALQTVESKNLQQITIYPCIAFPNPIGEAIQQEWQHLDRLLVQFWTSCAICPKVVYGTRQGGVDFRGLAPSLLPELTRRGVVDLAECHT